PATYKAPLAVVLTQPAEVREDKVVEPLTDSVPVMEEEAKKEVPLTVKPVDEALAKLDWPVTQRLADKLKAVPEATPNIGVTKVGEVWRTFRPLPVLAAMYKAPEAVDWTEPTPREEIVVEALAATLKTVVLEEEAILNKSSVGEAEAPCTTKVALGVVEPIPTLWSLVILKTEM